MSIQDDEHWPYFAVDLPGLTREGATELARWATHRKLALGVSVVDPRDWYVRYLDVSAVQTQKRATEIALKSGRLSGEDVTALSAALEDFEEWLATAHPVDDDTVVDD